MRLLFYKGMYREASHVTV